MGLDMYLKDENDKEVAYWRKANQIHKWFKNNCGYENDDTDKLVKVSREQLKQLRSICILVNADHSKAEELLPTEEGFFFGSTDYDEYYYDDLENTIEQLTALIENRTIQKFFYHAWW
ncbi:MAG: hypothetical protein U9O94_06310 [Nanoarchaeota archaeon]|nr:hypothetical protein [Nanoarchaeota archaeon]